MRIIGIGNYRSHFKFGKQTVLACFVVLKITMFAVSDVVRIKIGVNAAQKADPIRTVLKQGLGRNFKHSSLTAVICHLGKRVLERHRIGRGVVDFFVNGVRVVKDEYDSFTESLSDVGNVTWYVLNIFPKNIEDKG